jgi:hypothetical protein
LSPLAAKVKVRVRVQTGIRRVISFFWRFLAI